MPTYFSKNLSLISQLTGLISKKLVKRSAKWTLNAILSPQNTDTQWRLKSKISENLGRCGRQNMLWPNQKNWDWELIIGRAVKAISSPGVHSLWQRPYKLDRPGSGSSSRQQAPTTMGREKHYGGQFYDFGKGTLVRKKRQGSWI